MKTKKKAVKNTLPQLSGLLDIISPSAFEFKPRSMMFGDLHQRVLVIVDYPPRVNAAWLSRIATLPGVVCSIHATPTDSYELIEEIKISMGELAAKMDSGNPISRQRAEQALADAKHLLQKIDSEQQRVFYVTIVILIYANDEDSLQQRTKYVESILAAAGMRGRTPMFRQEEGLISAGPFMKLEENISKIGARNMPVETIAAAYPFVYSGINDGNGVLLGTDRSGGIVLVDFWKREGSRTNSNITVMGRPGTGKSTVIKKILMNEYSLGSKIYIIDPEREYKELCENLGGDWIDCGGGTGGRINPLQVRAVPFDENDEDFNFMKNKGPLALHFQTLRTFFSLYFKDLTKIEEGMLEVALEDVYRKFGITFETPQSELDQLQNSDWPTILDLYEYIEEKAKESADPEWKLLAIRLRPAAVGADQALWAGETTIQANSDFVVLDIHQLLESDESIRTTQFFNILSWAWSKIAEDRKQKKILAVDEAYLLVDPDTPQALQFLRNTSKRIRKYEGSLMVITHNMVDFLDPAVQRFGQALIDNPAYKIIFGQGDKDIEALSKLMDLSEREVQTLQEGKRGEALFIAGDRRIHAKFHVSPFEHEMFGSAGGR